jgi:RNA polymerase sigma factor (sigma-70 family)
MSKTSLQTLAANFHSTKSERDFTKLYERLRPGVFVFLKKYLPNLDDIEDAVSLTFAKAWSKIDQYDPYYQFSTWVYTIAKNEALQIIRTRNKKKELSYESLTESGAPLDKYIETCEIDDFDMHNKLDMLYDSAVLEIKNLPEIYKLALTKREVEGKKYAEIATELEWNIRTTKTRIRKGRELVKNCLLEKYSELNNK